MKKPRSTQPAKKPPAIALENARPRDRYSAARAERATERAGGPAHEVI
jgi:hypothetical protein